MKKLTILLLLLAIVAATAPASSEEATPPEPEAPLPESPLPPTPGEDPPPPLPSPEEVEALIALASARHEVDPDGLVVDHVTPLHYPNLDKQGWAAKLSGEDVYTIRALYEDGVLVATEDLAVDDAATWRAEHGALAPTVVAALDELGPGETVTVGIWPWDENETAPFDPLVPDLIAALEDDMVDADAWSLALVEAAEARAVEVQERLLPRLNETGIEARTMGLGPAFFADLRAEQARELARWDEIDAIELVGEPKPLMHSARRSSGAKVVNDRGVRGRYLTGGQPVRMAAVEVLGTVHQQHPLAGTVVRGSHLCSSGNGHLQSVIGTMTSEDPHDRGVAVGASVFAGGSCGSNDALKALADEDRSALRFGARILNHSFGVGNGRQMDDQDRYGDYLSWTMMAPVFVSAGNSGDCWDGSCRVASDEGLPSGGSIGYNVFSVGGTDDHDTGNSVDDTIAGFSSYKDPISLHNDRFKPELVAPAVAIGSLNNTWRFLRGWHVWQWGTSFASPIASGAAALLMARDGRLSFRPEAIKALLLASAVNNIHGGHPLSSRDGAGALNSELADRIVRGIDGGYRTARLDCSASPPILATETIHVTQQQIDDGHPVRAAAAWQVSPRAYGSNRDLPDYRSTIPVDLDIYLLPPGWTRHADRVARSGRFDNAFEVIEHTPTVAGDYTLVIRHHGFCLNPGLWGVPVAWAWSTSL